MSGGGPKYEVHEGKQAPAELPLESRKERSAQGGSAQGDGASSKPADDVVEADYEIVDEAKK